MILKERENVRANSDCLYIAKHFAACLCAEISNFAYSIPSRMAALICSPQEMANLPLPLLAPAGGE